MLGVENWITEDGGLESGLININIFSIELK